MTNQNSSLSNGKRLSAYSEIDLTSIAYEEISLESRKFQADWSSSTQTISIVFSIDPEDDPILADPVFLGVSDDILAIEKAWTLLPVLKKIPSQSGNEVILGLNDVTIEEINQPEHLWKATGQYEFRGDEGGSPGRLGDGEDVLNQIRINFNIGGGTRTMTKSLEVVSSEGRNDLVGPPAPGDPPVPAPDLRNAIGVTKDSITGIEVPARSLNVDITAYYRPAYINFTFIDLVADLIGNYNNDTFLGRPAGEVSLLNVTGGGTVFDIIPLTFSFSIERNVSNELDAGFTTLTMLGQHKVDYIFEKEFDEDAETVLQTPKYRYVHRVGHPKDFSVLGFGT